MNQPSVPPTRVHPKHKPVEDIASQLVGYQAVLQEAGNYLHTKKRLNQQLAFKLQTEINLLGRILQGMLGVPKPVWDKMNETIKANPGFENEVKQYAETLSPEPNVLLSVEQCKNEIMNMKRQGKWGWSL